jgi:hypothetical protein
MQRWISDETGVFVGRVRGGGGGGGGQYHSVEHGVGPRPN